MTTEVILDREENRASGLQSDEQELLKAYRRAKIIGYADISITIQDGKRVKLWLTEKIR